jgi:rhodanese-related sulfurtransferase
MLLLTAIAAVTSACGTDGATASGANAGLIAAAPTEAPQGLPDRDPKLAHELVEQRGALLIDARTPAEYAGGHIEGAINVPHDQVPGRLAEILALQGGDRTKPIVVYCQSGRRSGLAKSALVQDGFEAVTNLGGIGAW